MLRSFLMELKRPSGAPLGPAWERGDQATTSFADDLSPPFKGGPRGGRQRSSNHPVVERRGGQAAIKEPPGR
jgi:hypothetical protein